MRTPTPLRRKSQRRGREVLALAYIAYKFAWLGLALTPLFPPLWIYSRMSLSSILFRVIQPTSMEWTSPPPWDGDYMASPLYNIIVFSLLTTTRVHPRLLSLVLSTSLQSTNAVLFDSLLAVVIGVGTSGFSFSFLDRINFGYILGSCACLESVLCYRWICCRAGACPERIGLERARGLVLVVSRVKRRHCTYPI